MSASSVNAYRENLEASAKALQLCAKLEKDLKETLPPNEDNNLAVATDRAILEMNRLYQSTLLSEEMTANAARDVDVLREACDQRKRRVTDLDTDPTPDVVMQHYSTQLTATADSHRSHTQTNSMKDYGYFVRELLVARLGPHVPMPSQSLLKLYFEEYKRGAVQDEADFEMVGEVREEPRCPISKELLENPVRSLACGHVYSKESMDQILSVDYHSKCPSRGCAEYVHKGILVRDYLMDVRVLLWKEEEATRQGRPSSFSFI